MTANKRWHAALRLEPVYHTALGAQLCGDSRVLMAKLPADSVDLIFTSPPFPLLKVKSYDGNNGTYPSQDAFADWMVTFGKAARRVLKDTGSFVIDMGGSYQRGIPIRSLYPWEVPLALVRDAGLHLAQEFYWHNPAKLPSPIEWVNKRKIRVKDSVNTLWWMSKGHYPKSDITKVLTPYSERMKKLLRNPHDHYKPKAHPSGHVSSNGFAKDNGGAIPPNLLQIANTESSGPYFTRCKRNNRVPHPARFPTALPEFFINMLTDPDDLVLDIFSGSNTTGAAAEGMGRRWLAMEVDREHAITSCLRFTDDATAVVHGGAHLVTGA